MLLNREEVKKAVDKALKKLDEAGSESDLKSLRMLQEEIEDRIVTEQLKLPSVRGRV